MWPVLNLNTIKSPEDVRAIRVLPRAADASVVAQAVTFITELVSLQLTSDNLDVLLDIIAHVFQHRPEEMYALLTSTVISLEGGGLTFFGIMIHYGNENNFLKWLEYLPARSHHHQPPSHGHQSCENWLENFNKTLDFDLSMIFKLGEWYVLAEPAHLNAVMQNLLRAVSASFLAYQKNWCQADLEEMAERLPLPVLSKLTGCYLDAELYREVPSSWLVRLSERHQEPPPWQRELMKTLKKDLLKTLPFNISVDYVEEDQFFNTWLDAVFTITYKEQHLKFGVECDGEDYHQYLKKDKERDHHVKKARKLDTFRFKYKRVREPIDERENQRNYVKNLEKLCKFIKESFGLVSETPVEQSSASTSGAAALSRIKLEKPSGSSDKVTLAPSVIKSPSEPPAAPASESSPKPPAPDVIESAREEPGASPSFSNEKTLRRKKKHPPKKNKSPKPAQSPSAASSGSHTPIVSSVAIHSPNDREGVIEPRALKDILQKFSRLVRNYKSDAIVEFYERMDPEVLRGIQKDLWNKLCEIVEGENTTPFFEKFLSVCAAEIVKVFPVPSDFPNFTKALIKSIFEMQDKSKILLEKFFDFARKADVVSMMEKFTEGFFDLKNSSNREEKHVFENLLGDVYGIARTNPERNLFHYVMGCIWENVGIQHKNRWAECVFTPMKASPYRLSIFFMLAEEDAGYSGNRNCFYHPDTKKLIVELLEFVNTPHGQNARRVLIESLNVQQTHYKIATDDEYLSLFSAMLYSNADLVATDFTVASTFVHTIVGSAEATADREKGIQYCDLSLKKLCRLNFLLFVHLLYWELVDRRSTHAIITGFMRGEFTVDLSMRPPNHQIIYDALLGLFRGHHEDALRELHTSLLAVKDSETSLELKGMVNKIIAYIETKLPIPEPDIISYEALVAANFPRAVFVEPAPSSPSTLCVSAPSPTREEESITNHYFLET